jgi:MoaD family protein
VAVTVRVPTLLRSRTGGEAIVEGAGSTLRELLHDLEDRYPGLTGGLIGKDGGVHRFVNLYVNDEDTRYLQALDTPVADGDVVSILPAVAGG